nr:NTP transferase domain-containing protein [Ornithinimicrobium sp. F0845]
MAGGGGTRLGGVDKASLEVGGRPLLDRVLEGTGRARRVVVVGDTTVPDGVLRTVEDPPGGGPVAGIAAGLRALATTTGPTAGRAPARPVAARPDWTLVLAVDQPGAGQAVTALLAAAAGAGPTTDLVCPHDDEGHPQWLLAAYRTSALTAALQPLGTGHDISVRRLVSGLTVADAAVVGVGDIDTWEDHAAWQARLTDGRGGQE